MRRFEGKTVFITGGGRGQGRAHAVGFAREGADVAVVDVPTGIDNLVYPLADAADLEETVRLVEDQDRRCLTIEADVRDTAAMKEAVERTISQFGGIDILIANAGLMAGGKFTTLQQEDWDVTVDTILDGTWNTLRPAVPHMVERGKGGRIIITASTAVRWPQQNIVPYLAGKFGLIGIVKGLAQELIRDGITVNAVNPGLVNTPILMNDATYEMFLPDRENPTREEAEEVFKVVNPNGKPYMQPEEITDGVLYLASEEARNITGMQLDMSAGGNAQQAG